MNFEKKLFVWRNLWNIKKKSIFAYGTILPDKLFEILKLYLWNIKNNQIFG